MNKDSSESDYKPFPSPYPEPPNPPWEAELSEGATQPPGTDRPPPADPPPELINETDVSTSVDPLRNRNNKEDDELPFASVCTDDSDVDESPGKVANYECKSVWMIMTTESKRQASLCPLNQLTVGIEDFLYQRLVLYELNFRISINKADLNDGHPISKTILLAHAKKYIKPQQREKRVGKYYRGDFITGFGQLRPVTASKNTTPFSRLFPPDIDAAICYMESAWKSYYGKRNIIWHCRQGSVVSEVNVTAPLLFAILYRSSFISIRYDHYTTLNHLKTTPCRECAPYTEYVLRTMACLTQLHLDICETLLKVNNNKHDDIFKRSVDDMYNDTSKYLVYHCDENDELPYKYIELPHFVVIKLHHGDETIHLAMFFQQVPPYYFGIPVSLQKQNVMTPSEYQELISSSGEYKEISRYFAVIIDKVNEKLASERDTFFTYRPDLRGNDQLLQIYPYRFDQNNMPDCSCRYLEITIHETVS
jgi:hypothetical protein